MFLQDFTYRCQYCLCGLSYQVNCLARIPYLQIAVSQILGALSKIWTWSSKRLSRAWAYHLLCLSSALFQSGRAQMGNRVNIKTGYIMPISCQYQLYSCHAIQERLYSGLSQIELKCRNASLEEFSCKRIWKCDLCACSCESFRIVAYILHCSWFVAEHKLILALPLQLTQQLRTFPALSKRGDSS